jgi:hypothetical protein
MPKKGKKGNVMDLVQAGSQHVYERALAEEARAPLPRRHHDDDTHVANGSYAT